MLRSPREVVEGTAFFSFSQAFLALKVREQETTLLVSRAPSGRKEAKSKPQAPWERLRGQAAGGGGCQRGFREKLADGGEVVVDVVVLVGQFFSEEGGCKSLAGGVA